MSGTPTSTAATNTPLGALAASGTRFALVTVVEFGILTMIEDAPFWLRGGSIVVAALGLLCLEKKDQINAIHHGLFWQLSLLLSAIYVVGVGYGFLNFEHGRGSASHGSGTAPSTGIASATTTPPWFLPSAAVENFVPEHLLNDWRRTAGNDKIEAEQRVRQDIEEQLMRGKLVARGIPHSGQAGDKPIEIQTAEWQMLHLAGPKFSAAAASNGPQHSYDALEIRAVSGFLYEPTPERGSTQGGFPHPALWVAIPVALCLGGLIGYYTPRLRKTPALSVATVQSAASRTTTITEYSARSEYDCGRRKQEIDDLVASIAAGKTLESLKQSGALMLLLHSAAYTGQSNRELMDEFLLVRNAMVLAYRERMAIVSRYPENPDITEMIDCQKWPDGQPLLDARGSLMNNPNIPDDALRNFATWIFFKETEAVAKLNVWLRWYQEWCEEIRSSLTDKRRELG